MAALALYGLEDFKVRLGKTSAVKILESEDILKESCFNANVEGLHCGSDVRICLLIPGLGRSLGEGNGNPFQYSCLETPRTEKLGGLQCMGLQRVKHDRSDLGHTRSNQPNKDHPNAIRICLYIPFLFLLFLSL